jgi:guanylate kinase
MSDLPTPVVFCGPSGVGKGTLIEMLMKRFPNEQFGFSVSHTTRKPRDGEVDGVHYNFTTVDEIKKEIDAGKFVEYAEVHGNYYGTSIAAVEAVQQKGQICVLDIDIQGVMKVKESSLKPRYLFIAPPSMDELEKRLRGRGTETEEKIQLRLKNASKELEYGQQAGNFDRIFVNADLKATFEDLADAFKEWYPSLDEVAPDDEQKSCTSSSKCVMS